MPFSLLLLLFITLVRAHKLTSTSLEREFSEKNLQKINHFQQLIQEWTDKLNGNQIKQMDSLIKSMLVTECQILEKDSKNNSNNKIMLGAEGHGCQSLLKGESLSDGTELVEKVTLAFQTGGQKLIENLKRKEMEAKIAVNGGGTLAEILPLTKVDNILRMLEAKMSAGPAKDAVQNLLAQNSAVMPSDMVQLVMNLWLIVFNREEGNADHMLQRQQIQQSLLQSFKCCSSSVPAALIRKEKPALRRRYKRMISSRRHFLHEFGLFLASLTIICLIAFVLSIGLEKMDKILNQIMLTAAIAAYLYLRLINTPKLVRDFLQI